MTIILPQDCVAGWQRALNADTSMHWDMLAGDLVRHAADETDRTVRDDLLTLALVACELAAVVWRRRGWRAAHLGVISDLIVSATEEDLYGSGS